jgi:hypothetical protein
MYTKQLLIFIVSALIFLITPAQIWGLKNVPTGSLSVRQEFEIAYNNLEKNIKKEKTSSKKLDLIQSFRETVNKSRSSSPRQLESDEIYMDLLISTISEFPEKSVFNKKDCAAYKNRILQQFSPSESQPVNPPIEKGLKLLKLICL